MLSLVLLAGLFAIACTPQERTDPENYTNRMYRGNDVDPNNDNDNMNTGYDNMGNMGDATDRYGAGFDNAQPYTGNTGDRNIGDIGDRDIGDIGDRDIGDIGDRDIGDNDRLYGFFGNDYENDMNFRNTPMNGRNDTNGTNRIGTNLGINNNARLEDAAEDVAGVQEAEVIRNGDTCYVGVDATNNQNVATLRTQLSSKLRSVDPSIRRVYVTSDENRVSKLRNYARDIDLGEPVRDMMNDLEDLFR